MKLRPELLFPAVLACACGLFAAEERIWTSGSHTVTGEFIRERDGTVEIRLTDGRSVEIPRAKLSKDDQEYLASAAARPSGEDDPFRPIAPREPAQSQPHSLRLSVKGVGVSKDEAEKDAYRNAIRLAVGAYVDTETVVANDKLIRDEVITLSSAYIEHAATKRVSQENGLFTVDVDTQVRVTKLLDVLRQHNISVTEIDSSAAQDAIAKSVTQQELQENRDALLARALGSYPESCLKATIDGKPTFTKDAVQFRIKVEPDMEAFAAVADKVCEALAADGRRNGILRNDSRRFYHYDGYIKDAPEEGVSQGAAESLAQRFHNVSRIGTSKPEWDRDTKKVGTLQLPPVLSLSMETPAGLRDAGWAVPERDNGKEYLFVPFRADKSLRRIHWRWFEFSRKELEVFIKAHRHGTGILCSLLAADRSEITDDLTGVTLGWSETGGAVVLSPFCCEQQAPGVYAPWFSFGRTIELDREELGQVQSIACSVQGTN